MKQFDSIVVSLHFCCDGYFCNIFIFLFLLKSAFDNIWKKHSMNTTREGVDQTDSKIADDELDVYNLNEDQLWASSELEEMRKPKTSSTKKPSSAVAKEEVVKDEPETAPKKKAPRVKTPEAILGAESRPDFYHGVGPYNDVNLPGVWFFRIPHKVTENHSKPESLTK